MWRNKGGNSRWSEYTLLDYWLFSVWPQCAAHLSSRLCPGRHWGPKYDPCYMWYWWKMAPGNCRLLAWVFLPSWHSYIFPQAPSLSALLISMSLKLLNINSQPAWICLQWRIWLPISKKREKGIKSSFSLYFEVFQRGYKQVINDCFHVAVRCPDINVDGLDSLEEHLHEDGHLTRNTTGYFYRDSINLKCIKGRVFGESNDTSRTVSCLESGEWDFPIEDCRGTLCNTHTHTVQEIKIGGMHFSDMSLEPLADWLI